jgi:drug/metabolite transporter (DMT)-like permease
MNKYKNLGFTLAVASPICFSLFNVGVKFVTQSMSVWGLLFIRGFVGMSLVLLVAKIIGHRLDWTRLGLLALIGLSVTLSSASTTTAITKIPLYQAIVLLYLYPAFSVILAFLINGDRVRVLDCIGVLVAFIGCVLLVWPDKAAGLEFKVAHLFSLMGSFFYGLSCVLTRRLGQKNSGLEPFFAFSFFAALLALPFSQLFGASLGIDTAFEAVRTAGISIVGSLAQLMAFAALRYLPAFKVGVIGTLEIFGGALASWLIYSDPMTIRTMIGGLIILYAVFGFQKKTQSPAETTV